MKAELLRRPTLETIDPDRYPYPVAEWRDAGAYVDPGPDAAAWSWLFTRRHRDFQLCRDTLSCARGSLCPESRAPETVLEAMLAFPERNHALQRVEREGFDSDSIQFVATVCEDVLERRFHPFAHACWREAGATPAPGKDEPVPRALDLAPHRIDTPPFVTEWPGRADVADDSAALAHAFGELSTSGDMLGTPVALWRSTGDGDLIDIPDTDAERRVLDGEAVGDVLDHGRRARHLERLASDARYQGRMASVDIDLSANIGAQLARVQRILEAMQSRAGFDDPEEALAVPRNGTRILRFLDWQAEGDAEHRGAAAAFKRAVGVDPSNSTAWGKLLRAVAKYTADPVALTRLR